MSYASGMRKDRVTVQKRTELPGNFGTGSAGYSVETLGTIWASVTWVKGMRAMREGVMDVYDKVMVRSLWHEFLTKDCQLVCDGKTYVIDSFHADKMNNEIQITATELVQS